MKLLKKLSALTALAALAHPLAGAEYTFSNLQTEAANGTSLSYRPDLNYNNDDSSRWFSFEALDGSTDGALILGYENRGVLSTASITDFAGLEVVYSGTSATITQESEVVGLGDAETLSNISYRWQKLTNNNSASPNLKFEIWGLNGVGNAATFMGTLVYNSPQNNSAPVGTWVEETNIENTARWWATGTLQTYDQTLAQAIEAARVRRSFPVGTVVVLSAQVAVGSTGGGDSTDLIQGAVDSLSFNISGGNNDGSYAVNFQGTEGLSAYQSIQAAIDAATPGDTILLKSGTWYENVNVNKAITIQAAAGAEATVEALNGIGDTFLITVSDVTLQGLTIVGGDWTSPASERSAIYLRNDLSNVNILDNTIIAAGEAALLTQTNKTLTDVVISGNTFGGKTFVGAAPASGSQFSTPNFARQLITIQTNATESSVAFTNNIVGGQSGANGIGNTLATIDSTGATITGNTFEGTVTDGRSLFRARYEATITGNTFDSSNLSDSATIAHLQHTPVTTPGSPTYWEIEGNNVLQFLFLNTFDKAAASVVFGEEGPMGLPESVEGYVFASINDAISLSESGSAIGVVGDFTENVNIPADKTILLAGAGDPELGPSASITGTAIANVPTVFIRSNNSALFNLEINRSPVANSQNAVIFLPNDVEGVNIESNVFNSSGPIIESYYNKNIVDLSIVNNTFNASAAEEGGFVRGIFFNPAPTVSAYIAGNVFNGAYGNSNVITLNSGEAQISGNDFTGVTGANAFIGTDTATIVADGNCFPDTTAELLGTNTGTIDAAYNYFGRSTGAVESNYDGNVTVEPYLLSCDATYIAAIQAPGGSISPDYAYTNASAPAVFTITPNALSIVEDVLVNDVSVGAVGSYDASGLTEDSEITAVFSQNGASITVETIGNGTVSPNGVVVVPTGDDRSFIITPGVGQNIASVTYNGNNITGQVSPAGLLTIENVTGHNTLEVTFAGQTFNVTAVKSGTYAAYGNIAPASTSVSAGGSVEFTVTCPAPFAVRQVKVNGAVVSTAKITNGGTYTVENINANTTVEFTFGLNN